MGFGAKKKRESWSSRSFSMIIPENVKLFQRKGKTVIEKAMRDQSQKSIASDACYREAAHFTLSQRSSSRDATPRLLKQHKRVPVSNFVAEESKISEPPTLNTNSSELLCSERNFFKQDSKDAPYLTLNLGDTPNSLLDISDQYSTNTKDATDVCSMNYASDEDLAENTRELIATDDTNDTQEHSTDSFDPENTVPETGPHDDDSFEINISQMPWVLPARDAPFIGGISDLRNNETTSSVEEMKLRDLAEKDAPSLKSSNFQDSTISEVYSSDCPASTEYIIDPHRKILVNRGVYIFDPTNAHDVLDIQLSAEESFNPFEYV